MARQTTRRGKCQAQKSERHVKAGQARMAKLRVSGELAAFQRRGYDALVAKIGLGPVMDKVRAYREANPSAPERKIIAQLRALGWHDATTHKDRSFAGTKHFRREAQPVPDTTWYTVDFSLNHDDGVRIAIDVDGAVHRDTLFTNDDRRQFEKLRDDRIRAAGWQLHRVSSDDLDTDWWAFELAGILNAAELSVWPAQADRAAASELRRAAQWCDGEDR